MIVYGPPYEPDGVALGLRGIGRASLAIAMGCWALYRSGVLNGR